MYYTLGQRKGLEIGGVTGTSEAPWYVVAKDLEQNLLMVAQDHDHPLLMKQSLEASQLHWVSGDPPPVPLACLARIRHRQPLQRCELVSIAEDRCLVRFEQEQRAVTPGQSVVFYRDQECLGGGVIERA